ncbi:MULTISPECIES: hypothetical protein [unclassified Rhizobium]|uniref:hypothetical protein n=1 Tax=unclassified Rhizobium TaxID=2613769 RepID=UPI000EAAA92A|nr:MULTISPECIES: hypothetical protein [unclassified Rhizobium]AYG64857.1 hypothetical protein CCGE531_01750 [Rhizobium sp. CCGE531]AYG71340.1 hypothetical protein CCGE532_01740 [Rhizobium sp. CCGE532]
MQNTTVAALLYEFLFEVYRKIDDDRKYADFYSGLDENGVLREAFSHDYMGNWEWPADALEDVGVLKRFKSNSRFRGRYFYPVMTLDECATANFSQYEAFDNYCVAMFSFEYLHSHFSYDLNKRSPRFLEAVVSKDDIFRTQDDGEVIFDKARFQEKVMAHWDAIDVRSILPRSGA